MSYLNAVTTTQEFEIDLIELAYNHVDSVDDLKEFMEGLSSHIIEQYHNELSSKMKEQFYDDINCVEELAQFIDNIGDSITDEYKQQVIDEADKS